ncbi:serine/threonine-protein kinase [Terrabacter carboxydivorans]|uniref:non-specific serine/threonine protein kinase n=1 Tax=Terrabacter carboxydivorans TaxID=619730 RepID=A0ABN3M3K5_9MICO
MVDEQPVLIAARYRLMNRIGAGGMGHVWLAWDERLNRAVAVKQLHSPVGLPDAEARVAHDRAMREARITARLHHPNAVPVFDVVDHEGAPCLVMQYLPSRSLQAVLTERGPLPAREVARVGAELASALAAAHRADIVHRDVKPGNVLVADDGTARITDFGISHALGDASLTSTGMVTGTPAYLAPEVARGTSSSAASDVFSLGATLYTAVEGTPPFGTGDNAMALLHRVASGSITPPSDGPLADVLLAMLAASPEDRPTMREVSARLSEIASGRAPGAAAREPDEPRPDRTRVLPTAAAGTASSSSSTDLTPATTPLAAAALAGLAALPSDLPSDLPADPPVAPEPPDAATHATAHDSGSGRPAYPDPVDTTPPHGTPVVGDDAGRRRRRGLVLLAGLVVLVGAGLLAWALQSGDAPSQQAAPPPATSSTAPRATTPKAGPSTTAAPSPSATTPKPTPSTPSRTPSTTPATTAAPPAGATAAELASAVRDYYALLPGNTDAGWARLTDRYRSTTAGSRSTYEKFWTSVDSVQVRQATGSAPGSVVATLRYAFADGRRFEERTSYTLVRDGGILKIDRSSVLSSRQL